MEDPAEVDFTDAELDAALGKVKPRKAAGLNEVGSDYVRRLTSKARRWFLTLINESWRRGWIPQVWRNGLVIPILKKGKPPEVLGSYRPITLLANLGKVAERMVAERLTWWLEGRGAIDQAQAGFRKGRSTVDQCLRVSQRISDRLQRKPPERTLMVLFDYSRAFDTVWRAALLHEMLEMGVPAIYMRWIKAWLTNRISRVKIEETVGRPRTYKEGLPQCAVLNQDRRERSLLQRKPDVSRHKI